MKVILIQDVRKIGKKGEIKEVKAGYGQNFLINKGYAVLATEDNQKALLRENRKKDEVDQEYKKECLKMKQSLEPKEIKFKVKTGSGDKVFGSISTKQIVSAINTLGYKIDKHVVELEHPITTLGTTIVPLKMHKDVIINVKVKLEK